LRLLKEKNKSKTGKAGKGLSYSLKTLNL
jgi:hypothetical protein